MRALLYGLLAAAGILLAAWHTQAADGDTCGGDLSPGRGVTCTYICDSDLDDATCTITLPVPNAEFVVFDVAENADCTAGTVLIETATGTASEFHEVGPTTAESTLNLDGTGVERIVVAAPVGLRVQATIAGEVACTDIDIVALQYERLR